MHAVDRPGVGHGIRSAAHRAARIIAAHRELAAGDPDHPFRCGVWRRHLFSTVGWNGEVDVVVRSIDDVLRGLPSVLGNAATARTRQPQRRSRATHLPRRGERWGEASRKQQMEDADGRSKPSPRTSASAPRGGEARPSTHPRTLRIRAQRSLDSWCRAGFSQGA